MPVRDSRVRASSQQYATCGRKSALLVTLALGAASIAGCAHYEIVGYYAGWKPETNVAPRDVTVINYAFAYISGDGSIVLDDPGKDTAMLARLAALKHGNPDLRLMISVGGWTRS